MNSKKQAVATTAKTVAKKSPAKKPSVKIPVLELKAIPEDKLKREDKRFLSCVIGQLALTDSYELPLSVSRTDDGKAVQSYGLENVERAFYSLHSKMKGKVSIKLERREAQEGQFFVVIIAKSKKQVTIKFSGAIKDRDLKLPASSKRAKTAQKNKLDKLAEAREKRKDEIADLDETAKKQLDIAEASKEKRAKALAQKDGKKAMELLALEQEAFKQSKIAQVKAVIIKRIPTIDSRTLDLLTNDICAIITK